MSKISQQIVKTNDIGPNGITWQISLPRWPDKRAEPFVCPWFFFCFFSLYQDKEKKVGKHWLKFSNWNQLNFSMFDSVSGYSCSRFLFDLFDLYSSKTLPFFIRDGTKRLTNNKNSLWGFCKKKGATIKIATFKKPVPFSFIKFST